MVARCYFSFAALFFFGLGGVGSALAGTTVKKEIDVSFAALEVVKPVLDPVLSPQGKFLMLANKGAVLVIDTPEGILAAEQAIAAAQFPPADVALEFQFVTGLPARKTSITVGQEVPFPTAFAPATIIVGPNGAVTGVVPATPTEFRTRNIGVTSESVSTVNPDGSITLDINTESTAFEGFINYGSALLPSGGIGTVPVNERVGDPLFFTPFINTGREVRVSNAASQSCALYALFRDDIVGGSIGSIGRSLVSFERDQTCHLSSRRS